VLTLAGRGDLRLRTIVDEHSGRLLRTLVNCRLLLTAGSVLLGVAALHLVAADEGPTVASDTGLFEVLGYGMLLFGAVLLLRVVAVVARDGTS
jgi:hypothetical protein